VAGCKFETDASDPVPLNTVVQLDDCCGVIWTTKYWGLLFEIGFVNFHVITMLLGLKLVILIFKALYVQLGYPK